MGPMGMAFSGGPSPTEIVDCAALAEELGYESVWVAEGHGGDQFATLSACALRTSRVRLGTAITSIYVRSIPTIAMAAASVDDLSGGRFILGIGSSHKVQVVPEHGAGHLGVILQLADGPEALAGERFVSEHVTGDVADQLAAARGLDDKWR